MRPPSAARCSNSSPNSQMRRQTRSGSGKRVDAIRSRRYDPPSASEVFCEGGGTGRRAGLRSRWGNPCGFDSRLSHLSARAGAGRRRHSGGTAEVVQSRVEDLSPVVKKVSVELTPDRVKDALDRAYTNVSRTVKLKGYRQGHVPRRLVERYFGDDVKKDVAQKLVTGSIHEALAEHKLDPVAPPRVENGAVEAGQPFKYTATVEVRPRVEPKDYEGLGVPKAELSIADAQVDERLLD